jgi:hypothetical protein
VAACAHRELALADAAGSSRPEQRLAVSASFRDFTGTAGRADPLGRNALGDQQKDGDATLSLI